MTTSNDLPELPDGYEWLHLVVPVNVVTPNADDMHALAYDVLKRAVDKRFR